MLPGWQADAEPGRGRQAMIVIITVRGHEYTFASLVDGSYGFALPRVRTMTYERLLTARRVPRATYIFTDLDRLASWELRLAADLYRRMREAKLRCLNNPAPRHVAGRAVARAASCRHQSVRHLSRRRAAAAETVPGVPARGGFPPLSKASAAGRPGGARRRAGGAARPVPAAAGHRRHRALPGALRRDLVVQVGHLPRRPTGCRSTISASRIIGS